ncbi:hypothetical protein RTP6_003866 [Batrachochytrium dendrobatidis]
MIPFYLNLSQTTLSKSTEDCANVDDFKEAFNKKLSRDFDSYDAAQLSLSLTDGGEALQPYDPVPAQNTGDHPLLITITGVSAASPTQLVIPSSTDNTSGNFTATHSPLVGKVLSVSINQNKLIKYLTPVGSSPTTPMGNPSTPIELSTLGLELEQLMFWKNTTARLCIVIDVQRRSEQSFLEESPPITIVLITGFDGKPLNEVISEEEFKRVMPIRSSLRSKVFHQVQ